jgi:ankyrin repeat protein
MNLDKKSALNHSAFKMPGKIISVSMKFIRFFLILIVPALFSCTGKNKGAANATSEKQQQVSREQAGTEPSLLPSAGNGEFERVKELLEKGADANEKDEDNRTALMYASFNGYAPVVKELLKHNADVNSTDINGRSALMFAASGPFPETVKLLLENGAEPNIQDAVEHFTAFMFAAAEGQLENVKVLLEYGANPNLKDVDGEDALIFAQNNGHTQVVGYLKSL